MLKLNPKQFLLRKTTIYDIKGMPTPERREEILRHKLLIDPKYVVKGGNSKTNPYKIHYDMIIAEKREKYELLKNSLLWSPNYTPKHFKFLFVYPVICIAFFLFYLRNIAWPRRMLKLKKQLGYSFPELEEKGWLIDWEDDEDEDDIDLFKTEENKYQNWSLLDAEKAIKEGNKGSSLSNERNRIIHDKIQGKLEEIYNNKIKKNIL